MSAGAYAGPARGRRRRGSCPSVPFARTQSAPFQAGLPAQGFVPPAFPMDPLQDHQWHVGGTPARPILVRPPITAARPRGNFKARSYNRPASSTPLPFSRGPDGSSRQNHAPVGSPPEILRRSAEVTPNPPPPQQPTVTGPESRIKRWITARSHPAAAFPVPPTLDFGPKIHDPPPPDLNTSPGKVNLPTRYPLRV